MIFIILAVLIVYYIAKIDAEHYLMGHYFSDYTSRYLQLGSIFLTVMYFSLWKAIVFALLFWALYEGIKNYLLGRDIFYVEEDNFFDKYFRFKYNLRVGSKIIALIVSLII